MNEQITFDNLNLDKAYKNYYNVPDYQREYVWKREEVEQLMSDITEAYLTAKDKDYFVGSTVVFLNQGARELIDGQQRMTTFYILLCVLKHIYKQNGIDVQMIQNLIHNIAMDCNGDPVAQYHLKLQYEDASQYLEFIANTSLPIGTEKICGRAALLYGAANHIFMFIQQQFPDISDLKKFAYFVLNRVVWVQIQTPDMSEALKIFETINQRGIGLTPMDLLKNMIFRQVPREKFGTLNAHWKSIMETLQGKELPLRFLRYYLMANYDTSDRPNGILREDDIYKWLNQHPEKCGYQNDPFGFVNKLKEGAALYVRCLYAIEGELGRPHLKNITLIGGSTYRLHLWLLLAAKNFSPQAQIRFRQVLESVVFYATVNQIKTNEVERIFAQWCPKIRVIGTIDDLEAFIQNDIVPVITQWKVNCKENFMLLGMNTMQQYRIRFILARITKYIEAKKNNGSDYAGVLELYDSGIQIEHIMPATYEGKEPPFGLSKAEYDVYKQRLGNLTLLERTINASIQNNPFEQKCVDYRKSSYYLTRSIAQIEEVGKNTAINHMNQKMRSWSEWNPNSIRERQEMLYSLSEDIWDVFSDKETK